MRNYFLVTLLALPVVAKAAPVEFSLKSKDGLAQITGEVDYPNCGKSSYPAVLIVGGTGLFYRNGYFGRSGTDRDFLFTDFSRRFDGACIATVRFDYRGVSCDLKDVNAIQTCVDQQARSHVSDETILEDIQTVYDFAGTQPSINPNAIALLGHSEGTLNISRLVARGTVTPVGIMYFGGITESAKEILHWQIAVRPVDWAFEMDSNHDGILTNEEIKANFQDSKLNGEIPVEALLSPTGSWTRASLSQVFEKTYADQRDATLAKDDSEPSMTGGIIFSSCKYWKRWFTDDASVLENLKEFRGPIEYHNGGIDSQAPGARESGYMASSPVKMKSPPKFFVHPGKGHGLGPDPLYGPLDESIARQITSNVAQWLQP